MRHVQKIILGSCLVLFFITGARNTFAQSEAIKTARETVIENLTTIQTTKENTLLSPEERALEELALKQTTLANLCTLSLLETKDVRMKLEASKLTGYTAPFEPLRVELIENLIKYERYFTSLRELVPATESAESLRALADQFEEKREIAYNADIKKAVDLLLVLQLNTTLDKAFERLDKISTMVKRARGTRTEYATRLSLLNSASIHLAHAKSEALSAHNEVAKYLIPANDIDGETMSVEKSLEQLDEKLPTLSARAHTEESIALIKKAYGDFIAISDSITGKKSTAK